MHKSNLYENDKFIGAITTVVIVLICLIIARLLSPILDYVHLWPERFIDRMADISVTVDESQTISYGEEKIVPVRYIVAHDDQRDFTLEYSEFISIDEAELAFSGLTRELQLKISNNDLTHKIKKVVSPFSNWAWGKDIVELGIQTNNTVVRIVRHQDLILRITSNVKGNGYDQTDTILELLGY